MVIFIEGKINGIQKYTNHRDSTIRFKLIPVVMLTSSKEDKDLIESYKLGANSYIQKPVDFKQFVSAVQQVGLYWMVINVNPPLG